MKRAAPWRVRSLVAAIISVPIIGLAVLGGAIVLPRYRQAELASEAQARMQRTKLLVTMSGLVTAEQLPLQLQRTGKTFGIDSALMAQLMRYDPVEESIRLSAETDAFVAQHPDDPIISQIGLETRVVREQSGLGSFSEAELYSQYRGLFQRLVETWSRQADLAAALPIGDAAELRRSIELVTATSEFSDILNQQYMLLFQIVAADQRKADTVDLRLPVQELVARESLTHRRMMKVVDKDQRELADSVANGPAALQIRSTIDRFLDTGSFGVEMTFALSLVSAVDSGVSRQEDMTKLVKGSLNVATNEADELKRQAQRELWMAIAAVLGLAGGTMFLAGAMSRALTQSLESVARKAKRVADGDLLSTDETRSILKEITTVHGAMDDLVDSLRLVQRQSGALATGALDDEVLRKATPGQLGATMQASVQRLVRSIREREELQEQLSHQATHDSLTGLPNRASALLGVEQALHRSVRRGDLIAVFFVDLDDFKRANDEGGHQVGDASLRVVGKRITETVRSGDLVARLGGDEFLVVSESIASPEAAEELAQRLVRAVSEPMELEGIRVHLGASIGYVIPDQYVEAGELLRRADLAMYAAKEQGRGRAMQFDVRLGEADEERRAVEREMREALINGEGLSLVYQPIVSLLHGGLLSVEALLRWHHPIRGFRSPAVFIPMLEGSPVIRDVGRWVLGRATVDIERLRHSPAFADVTVSVNLSGRHVLHTAVVNDVEAALAASGLPGHALTVELTETAIADLSTVVERTRQIQGIGVMTAIDDFGTGYSSIAQLSRLTFNKIKIDRTFIDQISQPASRRIVELVIEVGHTLGMEVIAEGVEEESQRRSLAALGCDAIQGFLYSEPMTLEQLQNWRVPEPDDDVLLAMNRHPTAG
jgi:diguanylate cyclase (GGDEF)-like protein